jgi:transposase
MTAARYQEQVLDKVLHDFYQSMAEEHGQVLFQQDGAPSHTAKSTGRWLDQNEIKIMPHPPGSPDLNPIEPLWHTLKDLIRNWMHIPTTLDELKIATNEAWDQITEADIDKHVNSMEK